ncbi:hypothetical protein [Streptomyces sp. NE5-10]|uniref:hypothetical protein n=1 Tax=Streptomyces sp. NE5-10 TaxID=2759674 RepID=UPI001905FB77|nr:hypothetical protein [Streptomyces sp. NE5-10]
MATGAALHEFAAPGGCTSLAVTADGDSALSGGTGSHVLAWDVPPADGCGPSTPTPDARPWSASP